MERIEYKAGANQKIVAYLSDDDGADVALGSIFAFIADDASTMEAQGWRIVSTSTMPIRQMGTAGNILFQSGGQFVTQAAVAVVYGRA
jgi:hypothetical protein